MMRHVVKLASSFITHHSSLNIMPPVQRELELAVIVPTLDERENVVELIGRLKSVLAAVEHEIIVVDDDSSDGTADAVRELAQRDPSLRLIRRVGRRGLS